MSLDRRRALGDSEKAELLAACEYQCQGKKCNNRDLTGQVFHFHHVKPYAKGGRTTRFNHRVLCEKCHQKLHKSSNVGLEVEFGSVWNDLRGWQQEALTRFVEFDEQKMFVEEAAPGAGKTMFAACASRYVIDHHPEINHVICIAPWVPILSSMRKTFQRLMLETRDGFHYDKKRAHLQLMPDVDVTLDTYHGFCNPITIEVLEYWHKHHDFRFMLILDEVHHTNIVSGTWGPYAERVAEMASKLLVMSGTFFRSDNRQISFLKYENGKPKPDHSITYTECVAKQYVRQVAFRYHDPSLEILNTSNGQVVNTHLSKVKLLEKMVTKAKQEVLNPEGPHVEEMILDTWRELQVMRRKWPDAACLVVCSAGASNEERSIHTVQSRIKSLTHSDVEVVTCDDASSRGRIDAFGRSEVPFLCAIRMVSEGVDIPRIRMVLFLSYTDSEMLFRQIVGRCVRYIPGREDDTAALVVMPKFPRMHDFAVRFEGEAKAGAVELSKGGRGGGDRGLCEVCQVSPCNCPCVKCGSRPCRCFVVLDSETVMGGGLVADTHVEEKYIERAKIIRETSTAHQHANVVQLADALQKNDQISVSGIDSRFQDFREMALKNLDRKVGLLARYKYQGDYQAAWVNEVHIPYGVTKADIEGSWRMNQIQPLIKHLKWVLTEVVCNAQR